VLSLFVVWITRAQTQERCEHIIDSDKKIQCWKARASDDDLREACALYLVNALMHITDYNKRDVIALCNRSPDCGDTVQSLKDHRLEASELHCVGR
jgi:hypothetical protein